MGTSGKGCTMAQVIAVYNAKGGVGKTTSCVNIAYEASRSGLKTLLWDLDAQGAAGFYYGYNERHERSLESVFQEPLERLICRTAYANLDLIPSDFSYRNIDVYLDECKKPKKQLIRLLSSVADEYDVVLLDCPPNLSRLADNIFNAVNWLLVPIIPTPLSLRTLEMVREQLPDSKKNALEILAFFSQVDHRKRIHTDTMSARYIEGGHLLGSSIPTLSVIEAMGVHRAPVGVFAGAGRAAQAYHELWVEISEKIGLVVT